MSLSGLNGFGRCARFGLQFGLLLWRAVRLPAASTLACPSGRDDAGDGDGDGDDRTATEPMNALPKLS